MAGMSLLRSAAASLVSRLQPVQRGVLGRRALLGSAPPPAAVPVRFESHGKKLFVVAPSTYYDKRFLKLLKFYTLLAAVPAGIAITLINIFIGPAELVEVPEGYVPDYWEYYQHPITRFLARNIYHDYQQSYEQEMALIHVENEKRLLRLYELAARRSMRQNGDGPWYQFETLDKNLIDNSPKTVPDA
ncbi:NADH dehydrogenase [ubiquinone] 1 beta subcomplex subunit 5, mitochondrial [Bufo bufo]|uniref:NADH dehydrogenase [ubiquinone] 1 beta subcomplex subunit 5, mitochondrial n=1 Tax=Bufo bufo TaxID=8384 RepID=UPI001ABE379D|nr:NADH dehydrogenase [ubiquinone] 1 beta subcomplex subunit 5, mitochondrial [Bufo bufo]